MVWCHLYAINCDARLEAIEHRAPVGYEALPIVDQIGILDLVEAYPPSTSKHLGMACHAFGSVDGRPGSARLVRPLGFPLVVFVG